MRKILSITVVAVVLLTGVVSGLYLANGAPAVAPIASAERGRKPYVVKIHARWCPKCMMTKGVWSAIEDAYAGRAHFLVLDYTNQETTAATEAAARRLGLDRLLESVAGTGSIVVLDAATQEVLTSISGTREFAQYAAAIDAALERVARSGVVKTRH